MRRKGKNRIRRKGTGNNANNASAWPAPNDESTWTTPAQEDTVQHDDVSEELCSESDGGFDDVNVNVNVRNKFSDPAEPGGDESALPSMFSASEDEGTDGYQQGGYHVVHLGELYNNRYQVLSKLGWGHFSTVWLCQDVEDDMLVAMKVQKSAQHYAEAAYDEIELLAETAQHAGDPAWKETNHERQHGHKSIPMNFTGTVQLLNYFEHIGPHGKHVCMIFEVMGPNVLAVIKRYNFKGVPFDVVHKIAYHTLIGLDYLHRICGIIHTDLKPENVLVGCPLDIPVDKHGLPLIKPTDHGPVSSVSARHNEMLLPSEHSYVSCVDKTTVPHYPTSSSNAGPHVTAPPSTQLQQETPAQQLQPIPNGGAATSSSARQHLGTTQGGAPISTVTHHQQFTHPDQIPTEEELLQLPRHERRKWRRKRARLTKKLKKQQSNRSAVMQHSSRLSTLATSTVPTHEKDSSQDGDESESMSKGTATEDTGVPTNNTSTPPTQSATPAAFAGLDEARLPIPLPLPPPGVCAPGPPIVRPYLKPTRSDPTLLTTYGGGLMLKAPYHHDLHQVHGGMRMLDPRMPPHSAAAADATCQQRPARTKEEADRACDAVQNMDLFNHDEVVYKIADLGNACWINKHFSEEIQTRQYRSPEVIMGVWYDTSADLWSFACMIFELITGDYLFDPKPAEEYPRDEDHLALCIELLGDMPKNMLESGRMSKTYFNSHGKLRHIKALRFWPLADVCQQKYHMGFLEAHNLASFLLPMLCLNPSDRASAQEMLRHPWLRGLPSPELEELFHPEHPFATVDEQLLRLQHQHMQLQQLQQQQQQQDIYMQQHPNIPHRHDRYDDQQHMEKISLSDGPEEEQLPMHARYAVEPQQPCNVSDYLRYYNMKTHMNGFVGGPDDTGF
eukprot:GEMP01003077.1.p1 GENE.GEMP01003077.1~~GEMP01003077.1.p1  ORF type:complete len:898 (+),score=241.93 GEMP01003077.1:416-3109(+)